MSSVAVLNTELRALIEAYTSLLQPYSSDLPSGMGEGRGMLNSSDSVQNMLNSVIGSLNSSEGASAQENTPELTTLLNESADSFRRTVSARSIVRIVQSLLNLIATLKQSVIISESRKSHGVRARRDGEPEKEGTGESSIASASAKRGEGGNASTKAAVKYRKWDSIVDEIEGDYEAVLREELMLQYEEGTES